MTTMTIPSPCAICRKALPVAKRVIDGRRYCPTCAKRLLRKRPCARCGQVTTWPRDTVTDPLCPVCRVGDRTCVRCGRPDRPVGLLLNPGVACASCAPFFKPARPCGYCGALSHHLTRRPKLGLLSPACPKCQRAREGHATCPVCGKARMLIPDAGGRLVCARCAAHPEPFVCPQCGKPGQRHSRSRCTACYWRAHGRTEAANALPKLALTWGRDLFLTCAGDLLAQAKDPRAMALRLPRYGRFFAWLEEHFPEQAAISGELLLDKLGADGLRRHTTILNWFCRTQGLVLPPDAALIAHSEQRRQGIILAAAGGTWYAPLLAQYHAALLETAHAYAERGWIDEHARMTSRTVTAALRAAASFLGGLDGAKYGQLPPRDSIRQLQQRDLDGFGLARRGYKAGIGGFISFLNLDVKRFGRLKPLNSRTRLHPGLLIGWNQRQDLLTSWLEPSAAKARQALVGLLLLAIGVKPWQLSRLTPGDIVRAGDEVALTLPGCDPLPLPAPVVQVVDTYLRLRPDGDNPWLFPGRAYQRPLRTESHMYHLRPYRLPAKKLFASAMYHIFLTAELAYPRMLANTLGIALPTGCKYFQATGAADNWQLREFLRQSKGTASQIDH